MTLLEQIVCEFCEKTASHHAVMCAGDHSEATGPFELCDECFIKFDTLYGVFDEEVLEQ